MLGEPGVLHLFLNTQEPQTQCQLFLGLVLLSHILQDESSFQATSEKPQAPLTDEDFQPQQTKFGNLLPGCRYLE